MENQIAYEKDNPATRIARQVKEYNSSVGAPAGKFVGTPVLPLTGPRVTTRAMAEPEPLDMQTQQELDEAARKAGVLLDGESKEKDIYGSLEEAMAVGSGVPIEEVPPQTPQRQTAREFMGYKNPRMTIQQPAVPRLINFKNVQSIDLIDNVVIVDGFEIQLPDEKVTEFRKYAIELALAFVKQSLEEALAELTPKPAEPAGEPSEQTPQV